MKYRIIGLAFSVCTVASVFFMIAYALNASTQLLGLNLFIALGAMATGIIVWALGAIPQRQTSNALHDYPSDQNERGKAEKTLEAGAGELERSGFLIRFFLGAAAALGLAAFFPVRSLAPRFGAGLFNTRWTPGARVVRADGTPVRISDLEIGSVLTVFPEGSAGEETSQTLLIRVPPGMVHTTRGRETWAPRGYVAFSKICTHAGCPVGLYRAASYQLLCPCHQSVFDVVNEARPVSGPAARPLPQLPLQIDRDGFLRAQSDYHEPVGPGFWQRS